MSKADAYLGNRQDAAKRDFALESWKRLDLDPNTGIFTFSTGGKPRVVARALIVGSVADTSRGAGTEELYVLRICPEG